MLTNPYTKAMSSRPATPPDTVLPTFLKRGLTCGASIRTVHFGTYSEQRTPAVTIGNSMSTLSARNIGHDRLGSDGNGPVRLGHFAEGRWQRGPAEELSEMFVTDYGLALGPTGALTTSLHEGGH
jgi:hypothetical protein